MDVFLTGFPKKLLVAITLVVLIAMCITPTEARTLERRHHKHNMTQTKDLVRPSEHIRRRHHRRLERLTLRDAKELRRSKNAQIYANEMKKMLMKIENTIGFFTEDHKQLLQNMELQKIRLAAPSWLPTVNFVDIHFNNFKAKINGASAHERKYKYLMPKLYKSLKEYEELFKRFQIMELLFPDDGNKSYQIKRSHVIERTLDELFSTIQEVNESMIIANVTVPPFKNKLDLSKLQMRVQTSECLINDYLLMRGYGNLLNNWSFTLKCLRKGKKTPQGKVCKNFEDKLKVRKDSRKDKSRRNRKRVMKL